MRGLRCVAMAALMVSGLLSPLPATAQQAKPDAAKSLAGKKIGITPYWLDDGNLIYTTAIKNYLEAKGASVNIVNPNGDAAVQRDQVNSFITAGYDAVVLCPVNPGQLATTVKRLHEANVRTVLFWNVLPDKEMKEQGVSAPVFELNDFKTYQAVAHNALDYAKNTLKKPPQIIIFDDASNPVLHARAEGFQTGVREADPNAKVLFRDTVKFSQNEARNKMLDLLTAYPAVNIIQPSNGEAGSGAYAALRSVGRGQAKDKVASSEYILLESPNNARMDLFLNKSTSVIDMVLIDFQSGAKDVGTTVETMLGRDDWKTMSERKAVPSKLMSHDCKTAAAEFAEQNSILQDYRPIDCAAYK